MVHGRSGTAPTAMLIHNHHLQPSLVFWSTSSSILLCLIDFETVVAHVSTLHLRIVVFFPSAFQLLHHTCTFIYLYASNIELTLCSWPYTRIIP